jgi:mediator of RNA polymerase II transcription subunit 6
MQFFSPAQGYSSLKSLPKPSAKDVDLLRSSTANTPARAPSPGAESVTASTVGVKDNQQDLEKLEEDELWNSLRMSVVYANDYIDQNPLVGEPGSFKFSSTQNHLQAQQQAAAKAAAAKAAAQEAKSALPSGKTTAAPTPTPQLEHKPPPPIRRGSKTPKSANKTLKRKNSD